LASGSFESDGIQERSEIVTDALIEPVELGTLLLLQFRVSREGSQQPGGQWRVEPFEQLQEDEADGVAIS
jgi:hypothetical protein